MRARLESAHKMCVAACFYRTANLLLYGTVCASGTEGRVAAPLKTKDSNSACKQAVWSARTGGKTMQHTVQPHTAALPLFGTAFASLVGGRVKPYSNNNQDKK